MRYEDFVGKPKERLQKFLEFFGHNRKPVNFMNGHRIDLGSGCSGYGFCGNHKVRKRNGILENCYDDEWKRNMPTYQKWAVTILTSSLLAKYRYLSK